MFSLVSGCTAHKWQKSIFLRCHHHEIYMVEAFVLKNPSISEIMILWICGFGGNFLNIGILSITVLKFKFKSKNLLYNIINMLLISLWYLLHSKFCLYVIVFYFIEIHISIPSLRDFFRIKASRYSKNGFSRNCS